MIGYEEITRIKQGTRVMILTAPDGHDRLLFYNDPFSKRHNPMIVRQIPVNGRWHSTEGLLSNQLALQVGGIITTKERGNLKYLEFVDKGYTLTKTTLNEI